MKTIAQLVDGARRGESSAFEELVSRFRDFAHARAYQVLRDHQRAEDVAQEAFAEAFTSLDRLREPAAFPGWFKRIVFKHIDRVTRVRRLETVSLETSPETAAVEVERFPESHPETLRLALATLPEHERLAAEPYYLLGQPQNDIAVELGIPVGTVKKRLFSARKRLRSRLADLDPALVPGRFSECLPPRDQLIAAISGGYKHKVQELLGAFPELSKSMTEEGLDLVLAALDAGFRKKDQALTEYLLHYVDDPGIHALAGLGQSSVLDQYLKAEPGLARQRDGWGRTPLHWAAAGGSLGPVELLIAGGADINARDGWGCTPLHLASEQGQTEVVRLLIRHGARLDVLLRNGKSVMHLAADSGDADLIDLLATHGAKVDLFTAARLGWRSLAAGLIRCDRTLVRSRLPYGATPLHLAAEAGQAGVARVLLEHGARLDMVAAAELGWIEELRELLELEPVQVNAHAGSFGFTPLHAATTRGNRDVARLLLAGGARVDATDPMYHKTPLGEAIYYGNEAMAHLLTAHGAGV